MSMQHISGMWLSGSDWVHASCEFDDVVRSLRSESSDAQNQPRFIPAPVDLHIHGAGGFDCMQGEQAMRGMLKAALQNGTAALLATSVTAPFDDISAFVQLAENVMKTPDNDAAQLLGVHLEGPFINPEKLGAQPPYTARPDLSEVRKWLRSGVVKIMTIAPEIDRDGSLMALLHAHGVKVQIGHSNCTWHQAHQALSQGCGVTHLYNAMGGVSHRDGGTATAALAYANYAEVITDGVHVEQAAFDAAYRAIPNLYSVTDATAAAGMPDGDFMLGSLSVTKQGSQVRLPDGTLAGSCLTQIESINVLRRWGLEWPAIVELTSARPARWINDASLGKVEMGACANWLELDDDQVCAIWVLGNRYEINANSI